MAKRLWSIAPRAAPGIFPGKRQPVRSPAALWSRFKIPRTIGSTGTGIIPESRLAGWGNNPVGKLLDAIEQQIGRFRSQRLRLKSVGNSACLHVGIAGRADVDGAVAHHHGAVLNRAALAHQGLDADRVRLLLLEAIAAVDARKVSTQA